MSISCRPHVDVHKGPSIKYITLFLASFYPLPLSNFVTHPGTPPESTSHISEPPIFSMPSTKTQTKAPCTNSLSIVHGAYCPGVLSGGLLSRRFCPGWFLSIPLASVRIHLLQQKVRHQSHHFKFHVSLCMIKIFISVTSHALDPLPLLQTITPSRAPSPSSVTYFMDGPHA